MVSVRRSKIEAQMGIFTSHSVGGDNFYPRLVSNCPFLPAFEPNGNDSTSQPHGTNIPEKHIHCSECCPLKTKTTLPKTTSPKDRQFPFDKEACTLRFTVTQSSAALSLSPQVDCGQAAQWSSVAFAIRINGSDSVATGIDPDASPLTNSCLTDLCICLGAAGGVI